VSSEHRAALVTGAAGGIGAAIAARLERDDWRVLTVDVRGDVGFCTDLTTRDGNSGAVATAIERFGRLDAVIPGARVVPGLRREHERREHSAAASSREVPKPGDRRLEYQLVGRAPAGR
jgi:NAD(P)-dependent dehydrogenase (short-subunit alcohol dehydrogenase family)